jgi:hypothetical protein
VLIFECHDIGVLRMQFRVLMSDNVNPQELDSFHVRLSSSSRICLLRDVLTEAFHV